MKNFLKRFRKDARGQIAMMFAVALPALLGGVILALDVSVKYSNMGTAQNRLDSFLLAAVQEEGADNAEGRLRQLISGHNEGEYELRSIQINEIDDKILISASMAYVHEPIYRLGVNSSGPKVVSVESQVTARVKVNSVRFRPKYAKGGYGKKVELFVERPGQAAPDLLSTMYYRADYNTMICQVIGNIATDQCGDVDLGDYTKAYMVFSIWYGYGRNAPNVVIRSDDKDNAYRFVIDGVKQENGIAVDVFAALDCEKKVHHAWEDQVNFSNGDTRDFEYYVEGVCDSTKIQSRDIFLSR